MDPLTVLHNRVSAPLLTEPGPTEQQKQSLFKAALRAPDHGGLTPWRFLLIEGEARIKFGEQLQEIKASEQASTNDVAKAKKMPLRAPTIIVVISSPKQSKVCLADQQYSAAAAAQSIILAAEAEGLGAIWRTGWPAVHPAVLAHLRLQAEESIIGLIYVGARAARRRSTPELDIDDFVTMFDEKGIAT